MPEFLRSAAVRLALAFVLVTTVATTAVFGLVYLEIEERHTRPGGAAVVNSLSVYEFNAEGKIRHLDVYLQQPR